MRKPWCQQKGHEERALGASIAALGLSNKAVYAGDDDNDSDMARVGGGGGGAPSGAAHYTEGPDLAPNPAPSAVAGPPLEEHLAQNTLWPEAVKLYGHADHVWALAADPLGRYLASACKVPLSQLGTCSWFGANEASKPVWSLSRVCSDIPRACRTLAC